MVQSRIEQDFTQLPPERQSVVQELPHPAPAERYVQQLVQERFLERNWPAAFELAQADVLRSPDSDVAQYQLAIAANLIDDHPSAAAAIATYQQLEPEHAAVVEERVRQAVADLRQPR